MNTSLLVLLYVAAIAMMFFGLIVLLSARNTPPWSLRVSIALALGLYGSVLFLGVIGNVTPPRDALMEFFKMLVPAHPWETFAALTAFALGHAVFWWWRLGRTRTPRARSAREEERFTASRRNRARLADPWEEP